MEIVKVFGIDWRLLAIQAVNFGILLFVLHRFLYRPLFAILEKRRKMVEESLRQAKEIASLHERVQKERDEILRRAREDAGRLIEEGQKRAKGEGDRIRVHAQEEAVALLERARQEIADEKTRAMAEIRKEAAELVLLATGAVLKEKVDAEKDRRLIEETIRHLPPQVKS